MAGKSGERLLYADLLRVCATVAVIMIHISGGWISEAMFACAAAVLLFLGMARVQVPTLWPYVLLGTAVGWFLYAVSVSRALHWAGEKLGGFWKKRAKGKG